MARSRGVFEIIFKNFVNSIKPEVRPRKFMGEDYFGTKYYERPRASVSTRMRAERFFVPVVKEDHEQEIPPEWMAWLRFRRRDPPTEEEVKKNYIAMLTVQKKAAELEALETPVQTLPEKSAIQKVEENSNGPIQYPVHDEYKDCGSNYQVKIKK
ncbi:NADH dehydrogenase [ubiquinone] 1 alpha subcomplex assembly factor 2 [Cephus cinctus]|uniref:NADH dehydrogenase [ubiquinone] 1 alpha subcomplex assembly factor 2 n=1 Tax=Cephus cinctus TaxID=211228 RepID=A0AAJ7FLH1_CEPCN|nr:NADH dehydrogenase [ubiquinone] 1 alpha subcomplex assembly factor 2 [Cephus cinctus]XP_015597701.1 NADH dehydrogenase [ubiquinone] 1 alpha subcomplex assembly factor 2 [Cephus cinctus]XP_015597702.1 NADH dehydrogenase [ubiquinone] 1 alpha subcomplex assembly factor 2 [Cephus cinctus]XP_015597703.1 NADH dehydrogenase [ubiquinone] 1 alpha subcomplex assembly factor 2 [Cephus cinctus]XP_015597704.1 NADH dehydrogenase [ubiquinone] 1 alpha subcomplex assembly factor 2 [Cephus cinctus]XP_0155977